MKRIDLKAAATIGLVLIGSTPQQGFTQQATPPATPPASSSSAGLTADGLPQAPEPKLTEPLFLRSTARDYTKPKSHFTNPIAPYTAISVPMPRLANSSQLDSLLRDGKIYLSLSDAIALALENNYDIAIARINLDIADTDLLRARAGSTLRGVSTGIVANTLGGTTSTITGGGGPGGTSSSAGGGGTGASGLVLSTNGGGPLPENLDPTLTSQLEYEPTSQKQANTLFSGGLTVLNTNTSTYNFGYTQGFITGTQLAVTFNNSRVTTNNPFSNYSPDITSSFRATATQHLLQGFGWGVNGRFILQAKNDRRITDSSFRQQVLYTVNQVENIYWGLVSAYEDVQAKERALGQSTQLTSDNRKQLEIGTLAPLDVVNSDSTVATDKQALIVSQTNLEYQQLIMKQAIARTLNDPALSAAPVIPTDRVGLDRLPEEDTPVEDLVRQAYVNNPQIEQAILNMKNNEITIKAEKNGLLPTVDAYAFYGASALGGAQSANALNFNTGKPYDPGTFPSIGYGTVLKDLFNSSAPDKGVGVNITIPLRNRTAQADQARSQMEYRQSQMRLQQIYTQIRIQVINAQFALTNDRAQVMAAQAAHDFANQSLDAEQKKYKLGASTTANVLQQGRNLATSENNLLSATAAYAKDRAALQQLLSTTLDHYSISIESAATGDIAKAPVIPGLTAPKAPEAPKPISSTPPPPPQ
ncbi:outer membrane protein TolC [Granulicella aggregans]|uniref:Outer membrane protein TolC n=1 Tax=Granulicella aggregans TaxID=474949 RepID=A0A7W7ZHN5_9BACT|nr:TolC family protein [Granulicella aggregans]MBB5059456.1 outer membrane protein TolC [Granulicella aggregans]